MVATQGDLSGLRFLRGLSQEVCSDFLNDFISHATSKRSAGFSKFLGNLNSEQSTALLDSLKVLVRISQSKTNNVATLVSEAKLPDEHQKIVQTTLKARESDIRQSLLESALNMNPTLVDFDWKLSVSVFARLQTSLYTVNGLSLHSLLCLLISWQQ
eukprot:Colp12_sorted_trinity150504_noHs@25358